MQLSILDYDYFQKVITTNGSFIFYDRGRAKMKIFPSKGDLVEVLSKNCHRRSISGTNGLSLCPVDRPIFIDNYFRRNWTENKTDLKFILERERK